MKKTRLIMGLPIHVEIIDSRANEGIFHEVFDYFNYVDETYSTYKKTSEISKINNGLPKNKWSSEMRQIMALCEQTKQETKGYFNIEHNGIIDPSGLVKGWAILNASNIIKRHGILNYYIDAGGDIQANGFNSQGKPWRIGIRNPFNRDEVIKTIAVSNMGVATSGTSIRGQHIYNPHKPRELIETIVSISVIGPDIYNADRFATAAFAMGTRGITFIEELYGYEAYVVDSKGLATLTSGFERYVVL